MPQFTHYILQSILLQVRGSNLFQHKSLIEEVKILRNHGLDSWQKRKGLLYDISKMGFNLRMSDIEAGL